MPGQHGLESVLLEPPGDETSEFEFIGLGQFGLGQFGETSETPISGGCFWCSGPVTLRDLKSRDRKSLTNDKAS